ncbi:MAG TPA: L,D-transpeptidase family protein, partial [Caulobacteraceae bacterium]
MSPKSTAAVAIGVGLIAGLALAPFIAPRLNGRYDALAAPLRARLGPGDPLKVFYGPRGYRPLWIVHGRVDPAAPRLIAALRTAGADNLDADAYDPSELQAALGLAKRDPAARARAEIALSRAYAAYVIDLHHPAEGAGFAFVDPSVRMPPSDPAEALRRAAAAPSLTQALAQARRMNPLYERLRAAFAAWRSRGPRESRLLAVNLERARALPPDLGARFVLVNAAAERLWFYDDRRQRGSMRVVVGARDNPTPQMIGAIRYALFNPSWNVPPDLVRDDIAPAVLRRGPAYLR